MKTGKLVNSYFHICSLYGRELSDHSLPGKWVRVFHHPARYIKAAQGKYEEAEKLNRQALEGWEKELGIHHPHTLTSAYYLAFILHRQERHSEAGDLYHCTYDGFKERLGSQHPTTVACCNNFVAMEREVE